MASTGIVTASALNFRASPNGDVIKTLPQGASVEILEDQGAWLKVSVQGQTRFVSAQSIQQQS